LYTKLGRNTYYHKYRVISEPRAVLSITWWCCHGFNIFLKRPYYYNTIILTDAADIPLILPNFSVYNDARVLYPRSFYKNTINRYHDARVNNCTSGFRRTVYFESFTLIIILAIVYIRVFWDVYSVMYRVRLIAYISVNSASRNISTRAVCFPYNNIIRTYWECKTHTPQPDIVKYYELLEFVYKFTRDSYIPGYFAICIFLFAAAADRSDFNQYTEHVVFTHNYYLVVLFFSSCTPQLRYEKTLFHLFYSYCRRDFHRRGSRILLTLQKIWYNILLYFHYFCC